MTHIARVYLRNVALGFYTSTPYKKNCLVCLPFLLPRLLDEPEELDDSPLSLPLPSSPESELSETSEREEDSDATAMSAASRAVEIAMSNATRVPELLSSFCLSEVGGRACESNQWIFSTIAVHHVPFKQCYHVQQSASVGCCH